MNENKNELIQALDDILLDKETNLLPENLKENVTVMGITGTLKEGIDTSDATATINDIVQEKTAYVNGQKIRGNILDSRNTVVCPWDNQMYINDGDPNFHIAGKMPSDSNVVDGTTEVRTDLGFPELAEVIGLTADKLVKGVTILGVEGAAEGELKTRLDGTTLYMTDNGNNP